MIQLALSKKEKQRIQRKIAELERQQKAHEESVEVGMWLLDNWTNPEVNSYVLMSQVARLERLAKESGEPLSPEFLQSIQGLREHIHDVDEWKVGAIREVRLFVDHLFSAADEMKRQPIEPKVCIQCNKRPAKFGDVCGRCAEASGIRPHGKV